MRRRRARTQWLSTPEASVPSWWRCKARSTTNGSTAAFAELLDDRDQLDLDHRFRLREAADLDRRAGRAGDAEIAHADIAALRELGVIGDEGVGLDDVGPGRAGRLQAGVEVLEGLLHLRPHIAG